MKTNLLAALAIAATLVACGAPSAPGFIEDAVMRDIYEVRAGKIASAKGQSEAVKQFAQRMVEAHTKSLEQLKRIVQAEKINTKLPAKLDAEHQAFIDRLYESYEDFDKTYLKQEVLNHKGLNSLLKEYAKSGENKTVKTFAVSALPGLKQQIQDARALYNAEKARIRAAQEQTRSP